MKNKTKATPEMTEWFVDPCEPGIIRFNIDPLSGILAGAKATQIVRACNNIERVEAINNDLVAALEYFYDTFYDGERKAEHDKECSGNDPECCFCKARAAIRKAKGK